MIKLFKNSILVILLCFLSSCGGEQCIDADDFGFAKLTIPARPNQDKIYGPKQNQITPWINSHYKVNGRPLMIVVKNWKYKSYLNTYSSNNERELSAWCPWYGESHANTLAPICEKLAECEYQGGNMCTEPTILNPPCLLKKGVGLYGLVSERGKDPNLTFSTMKDPRGVTFHLGEENTNIYDMDNDGTYKYAGGINYKFDDPASYENQPLYFKILDTFYGDNSGQYGIVIKSGVESSTDDPIKFINNLVKNTFFGDDVYGGGIVKGIYKNIVSNKSYKNIVNTILTIYIIIVGFSFLIGLLNFTQKELITVAFKVVLISLLLTNDGSWDFFNRYLLGFFTSGLDFVLKIISEAGATGPGGESIISIMLAPETIMKLLSLLFAEWRGFIFIIIYIVLLYLLVIVLFQATVIYLSSILTVGLIATLTPIYLCFMLFSITRSLFENWLKQLFVYSLSPIILFTGVSFISIIIKDEIYSTLGFKVCKKGFPSMGPEIGGYISNVTKMPNMDGSIISWWFPEQPKDPKTSDIFVPNAHYVGMDNEVGKILYKDKKDKLHAKIIKGGELVEVTDMKFCAPYECIENRYPDFPFLDPVKDEKRIKEFKSGNYVQILPLFIMLIAVKLLSKFNETAISMARFIGGGTHLRFSQTSYGFGEHNQSGERQGGLLQIGRDTGQKVKQSLKMGAIGASSIAGDGARAVRNQAVKRVQNIGNDTVEAIKFFNDAKGFIKKSVKGIDVESPKPKSRKGLRDISFRDLLGQDPLENQMKDNIRKSMKEKFENRLDQALEHKGSDFDKVTDEIKIINKQDIDNRYKEIISLEDIIRKQVKSEFEIYNKIKGDFSNSDIEKETAKRLLSISKDSKNDIEKIKEIQLKDHERRIDILNREYEKLKPLEVRMKDSLKEEVKSQFNGQLSEKENTILTNVIKSRMEKLSKLSKKVSIDVNNEVEYAKKYNMDLDKDREISNRMLKVTIIMGNLKIDDSYEGANQLKRKLIDINDKASSLYRKGKEKIEDLTINSKLVSSLAFKEDSLDDSLKRKEEILKAKDNLDIRDVDALESNLNKALSMASLKILTEIWKKSRDRRILSLEKGNNKDKAASIIEKTLLKSVNIQLDSEDLDRDSVIKIYEKEMSLYKNIINEEIGGNIKNAARKITKRSKLKDSEIIQITSDYIKEYRDECKKKIIEQNPNLDISNESILENKISQMILSQTKQIKNDLKLKYKKEKDKKINK